MSLPGIPVQTIAAGGGTFVTIDAIQIGMVTRIVPPGSVKQTGTIVAMVVIILILSGKWMIAMIGERVQSIS